MMNATWTLLGLLIVPFMLVATAALSPPIALPGCRETCGNISIPYPFGIGAGCSMPGFQLNCTPQDDVEKAYLEEFEVIDISLSGGRIRVYNYVSWMCYDHDTGNFSGPARSHSFYDPYKLSKSLNKFTIIGCDSLAYIVAQRSNDSNGAYFISGCVSACSSPDSLTDGRCYGVGCCQTTIPEDFSSYRVEFNLNYNSSNNNIWQFSPCTYAVLLDASWFEFNSQYVTTGRFRQEHDNGTVPLVVNWAIRSSSCANAKLDRTSYACIDEHSDCVDDTDDPGYLCNCSSGYHGNPYLDGGCEDIDECMDKKSYPCFGICKNMPGNHSCSCPPGTHGDPDIEGSCRTHEKLSSSMKEVIGSISGLVSILLLCIFIYVGFERRKLRLLKEKYFQQHGGRLLLEEIQAKQGVSFKIFGKEELEQATNKFNEDRVLGEGAHGTVYKGFLKDSTPVAIKKSKFTDEYQKNEFGKEMIILSQINHKNIIKLLGCCMEVEVPMLVYEYVPKGNLFDLIHEQSYTTAISLDNRLRIAYESADALAYLHSSASPPIIHRDVKSSNILLDDHFTAKVSDFGASVLAPLDEIQFATLVQGTCGYLDPEYLQTCQLTDKSDVYSFGVVLAELFTGNKALSFDGTQDRGLASVFVLAMKENRVLEIMDSRVRDEGEEAFVQRIAILIMHCLSIFGYERPTMKEVANELDELRKLRQHPWMQSRAEEIENLSSQPPVSHETDASSYYSLEKNAFLDIEGGR